MKELANYNVETTLQEVKEYYEEMIKHSKEIAKDQIRKEKPEVEEGELNRITEQIKQHYEKCIKALENVRQVFNSNPVVEDCLVKYRSPNSLKHEVMVAYEVLIRLKKTRSITNNDSGVKIKRKRLRY